MPPMFADNIRKVAVTFQAEQAQFIELDQSQPLAAVIKDLCDRWNLTNPDDYALQFSLDNRHDFVTERCPPVAVAIAKEKKRGVSHSHSNSITFPIIEVSDAMGWDSAPVKRELKLLQWNMESGGPAKSGVMAEFTDLAFHLRSAGDLTDEELDEVVDFLNERVHTQERTEIHQLNKFYDTLYSVSHKNVWMCSEECDKLRSERLKAAILDYFDQQPSLENGQITMLSFARETEAKLIIDQQESCENEPCVRGDIRSFIQLYGGEHSLCGRAIARILHGIGSPCFPAEVWGRVRRFWRAHMAVDFNLLRRMATQELVKLK